MNYLSKRLWGIIFIIMGLILGLNTLNITNINIFFDGWWTLFIIIPCFIDLFDKKESKTGNIIGLSIGIALLLAAQDIINFEIVLKLMIPFILVAIGISFLFSDNLKQQVKEKFKNFDKSSLENIVAIFSEQKINKDDQYFDGCNLDVVFGSITLDLRNTDIKKDSIIKASSIFGSIDIIIPEEVNVILKSTPIFGSVNNRLRNNKDNKKNIYIDAFCLFGGINIK